MKITYLNYMANLYGYSIGSTIKVLKLFRHLESLGHKVFFHWLGAVEPSEESPPPERKPSFLRDLLYTPKQMLRNLPQFWRERKIIRQDSPDVLFVRLDAFRISAVFLARLYRLPLIVEADGACSYEWLTFNNGRHLWNRVLLWCEKLMLVNANGIFTQSQIAKEYLLKTHHLKDNSIAVVTNGADVRPEFDQKMLNDLRQELGILPNAKVIGFVGSMQQWHGMSDVQNLVREILAEFDDAVFLFVGSGGALEKDLKTNLSETGSRVIFTGTVPNELVDSYIELFTVAIAPYPPIDLFYFSPMKVFEYMASAKPIIASNSGQITDILQHAESALLYEPGNIPQLKEYLVQLLKDTELQKKIARNAHQTFVECHTWTRKAGELNSYLKDCLRDYMD
jgi:glycosyltransferase involved in cell wall biosynthesis